MNPLVLGSSPSGPTNLPSTGVLACRSAVAREWFEKHPANWEASYSVKLLARLEANVFPWLGDHPIRDIKPPELLSVLRRVESRGVLETAHRLMNYCGNIYRYAVATGRAERDISSDLRGASPPSTPQHHASVTDLEGVAALLRAIDGYRGSNVVGSLGPHGRLKFLSA